ncbi:MAG: hypothetical protein ABSF53_25865 [Terracidiphilus sp.]
MSSTDPAVTGALQALNAVRKALGEAHQRLVASAGVPDLEDLAETSTLVGAVSENLMKVNMLMIGRYVAN